MRVLLIQSNRVSRGVVALDGIEIPLNLLYIISALENRRKTLEAYGYELVNEKPVLLSVSIFSNAVWNVESPGSPEKNSPADTYEDVPRNAKHMYITNQFFIIVSLLLTLEIMA